jgi:hypothetical protein
MVLAAPPPLTDAAPTTPAVAAALLTRALDIACAPFRLQMAMALSLAEADHHGGGANTEEHAADVPARIS